MKSINKAILKKSTNSFLSEENEFVDNLFNDRGIKFTKNSNGEYDINGNFDLFYFPELIVDGKLIIKFGKVSGKFSCHQCYNLTSLEGCPREVSGYFWCSDCFNLTSLEGNTKEVGGDFYCNGCDSLISICGTIHSRLSDPLN